MDLSCEKKEEESSRREESESSGNLNVNDKRRSLVRYGKVNGILGIYILENLKASRWVAVKPSPIASRTGTKINIK